MATRGKSITINYVAWDTSANQGRTGDVANHTLRWIKDGVSAAPTNSPAEVDATNAPGVYKITLTAAEADADIGTLAGASSTANVSIMPITIQFERLPDAAPGSSGGVPTLDANLEIAVSTLRTNNDKAGYSLAVDQSAVTIGVVNALGAQAKADVNAEVDAALDTAIPASPTANSINERIKALDDNYTSARATKLDNLDAAVSTRSSHSAADVWSVSTRTLTDFVFPVDLSSTAIDAIWDEAQAGHTTPGSFGEYLDAKVSSRLPASSAPANWSSMVISANGAVDSLVQGFLDTLLTESTVGRIAGNFDTFFENNDSATAKVVDDVGSGGGGGTTDWTTTERNQIRYRLGIDGTTSVPSATPDLSTHTAADVWSVASRTLTAFSFAVDLSAAAVDAIWDEPQSGHATAGTFGYYVDAQISSRGTGDATAANQSSILNDLAAIKGTSFDTNTDSLQAIRDRGDAAWTTATGFSTHSAADVWAVATRSLTDKSGFALDATEHTAIADATLSRNVSNVEATAPEHSLCTTVLAMLESAVSGTTWTIKRTDGVTTHATKTVTTDANADPITGVS